jgi:hypothetical protein
VDFNSRCKGYAKSKRENTDREYNGPKTRPRSLDRGKTWGRCLDASDLGRLPVGCSVVAAEFRPGALPAHDLRPLCGSKALGKGHGCVNVSNSKRCFATRDRENAFGLVPLGEAAVWSWQTRNAVEWGKAGRVATATCPPRKKLPITDQPPSPKRRSVKSGDFQSL